jgi:dCTP diphosphatase
VSDLAEIRDASRAFIAEREWQRFQDPKSILLALVGEVGELAELLQWLPSSEARDLLREEPLNTRVSEEMADVLVYLVGLADQCGVDLRSAAIDKIKASAKRYPIEENRGIAPGKA